MAGVGVKTRRAASPAKRPWGLDAGSGHVRIVEVREDSCMRRCAAVRLARMGLTVRCRGDGPSAEVVAQASETLALLASPARLQIVWFIGDEEADVTSLTQALGLAGPAVSQHLTKLRLAGVVASRHEGRRRLYRVADPQVVALTRQIIGIHGYQPSPR